MRAMAKIYIPLLLRHLVSPRSWVMAFQKGIHGFPGLLKAMSGFVTFFFILSIFMSRKVIAFVLRVSWLDRLPIFTSPLMTRIIGKPVGMLVQRLESVRRFQVKQSYLIELAYQSLRARTSRILVTMFGMAAGVGIIVYLLSLGYGIERLVISQVASLDELRIIDVSASENTALKINDAVMKKIRKIQGVDKVHPLISLVGRISFKKAQSDVLVFAAHEDYLELSGLVMKKGKIYSSKDFERKRASKTAGAAVAGASIQSGTYLKPRSDTFIKAHIVPNVQARVWESCDIQSRMLGYTDRVDSAVYGYEMWGGTYSPYSNGGREGYDDVTKKYLGAWVLMKVPLFVKDEADVLRPLIGKDGYQVWQVGCIEKRFVQIQEAEAPARISKEFLFGSDVPAEGSSSADFGQVLGEATGSAEVVAETSTEKLIGAVLGQEGVQATGEAVPAYQAHVISTDSAGIEQISLEASQSAQAKKEEKIAFEDEPFGFAVISSGLMKILGISEKDVIGTRFDVSFILVKALMPGIEGRSFSENATYEVIGLIDDAEQPYFYVPLSDIQKLGVTNFSQMRVVLKDDNQMDRVRAHIETLGYNSASSADTVKQIESLFANVRIVLASIGLVALAVASLGMFNTMTVSLLERTREIGGMKVIGMVSGEVQDLFLAEGMIMGFAGGVGGLILGFAFGQVTSVLVSVIAVSQGLGFLQLTYIPPYFTIVILLLSFVVGIVTGLYPAYRAKNTSALNALRYE